MQITGVKFAGQPRGKFLKYVSAVIDKKFVIKSMKLIQAKEPGRIILTMPSRPSDSGEWDEYYHPITREFRQELETAVMDAYRLEQETSASAQAR